MTCRGRGVARLRVVLAAGVLASVAIGGCTTPAAAPPTETGKVAPAPGPTMTGVAEAALCTSHPDVKNDLPGVQTSDVFPGKEAVAWGPPSEISLGPDGGDLERCPGELPLVPSCDGVPVPWAGLNRDSFLTASGATRDVQQEMEAAPADAVNPDWAGPGSKVLTYQLSRPPAARRAGSDRVSQAGFHRMRPRDTHHQRGWIGRLERRDALGSGPQAEGGVCAAGVRS